MKQQTDKLAKLKSDREEFSKKQFAKMRYSQNCKKHYEHKKIIQKTENQARILTIAFFSICVPVLFVIVRLFTG